MRHRSQTSDDEAKVDAPETKEYDDGKMPERKAGNCFIQPHLVFAVLMLAILMWGAYRMINDYFEDASVETDTRSDDHIFIQYIFGDFILTLEVVGIGMLVVFGARYFHSVLARRPRYKFIESGHDMQHLIPYGRGPSVFGAEYTSSLPKISIIAPVKFHGNYHMSPKENWKSQLCTMYKGKVEAIFSVENKNDGAVQLIRELQEELKDKVDVKLAIAGLTGQGGPNTMHSQKIHNQLAALKQVAKDTKYVLFVDIGCRLHPGTVHVLSHELEKDPRVFVSTGYPLDVPPPGASIWAWSLAQFRYMTLTEFLSDRSTFVWGGAMMLRKSDLDHNRLNILDYLRKGGYSDDMCVQALAQDNHYVIATPIEAIFANPIKKDLSLWSFWDFLHRQNFVLTTYISVANRVRHMTLFYLYLIGNFSLVTAFCVWCIKVFVYAYDYTYISRYPLNFAIQVASFILCPTMMAVQKHHLLTIINLINILSPDEPDIKFDHFSWYIQYVSNFNHFLFGFIATVRNILIRTVNWRGIYYRVKRGRIVEISHQKPL